VKYGKSQTSYDAVHEYASGNDTVPISVWHSGRCALKPWFHVRLSHAIITTVVVAGSKYARLEYDNRQRSEGNV